MIRAAHPGFEPRWTGVAFRPYLLNPELEGREPIPKVAHLEAKLGKPLEQMRSVARLRERGGDFGLKYSYEPGDLASGTADSHRLLRYVNTDGGVEAAFEYRRLLMRGFNENGRALSDRDFLLRAAADVGADQEVAEAVLDSGAYATEVTWLDREARKEGISSVPHYRFHTPGGLHSVTGYYEEWHFLDAMYRSFAEQAEWEDWADASAGAMAAADALTALHHACGSERQGEGSPEMVSEAEARVEEALRDYRERFGGRQKEGCWQVKS